MNEQIIDQLIMNSQKQEAWVRQFSKKRYLFETLKQIDPEYFVGVKGIRGIGKTVLLLQLASETPHSVYFSADSVLLPPSSLYETIRQLFKRGYQNIFIDEIHRKPEWDADIKTIYDEHEGRVFFSGSSALDISKTSADLSRRVVLKELFPSSFREFLNIQKNQSIPKISLEQILKEKNTLTKKYLSQYESMKEFMEYGGMLYPKKGFMDALENSIQKVVLQDLSTLRDINIKYETDVYKLLHLISRSPPF